MSKIYFNSIYNFRDLQKRPLRPLYRRVVSLPDSRAFRCPRNSSTSSRHVLGLPGAFSLSGSIPVPPSDVFMTGQRRQLPRLENFKGHKQLGKYVKYVTLLLICIIFFNHLKIVLNMFKQRAVRLFMYPGHQISKFATAGTVCEAMGFADFSRHAPRHHCNISQTFGCSLDRFFVYSYSPVVGESGQRSRNRPFCFYNVGKTILLVYIWAIIFEKLKKKKNKTNTTIYLYTPNTHNVYIKLLVLFYINSKYSKNTIIITCDS